MLTKPKFEVSTSRRLTASERSKVARAKAAGASTKELAAQYGVSEQTIRNIARRVRSERETAKVESAIVAARVPVQDIQAFDAAVGRLGIKDKSTALRAFIRWPGGFFHVDENTDVTIRAMLLELTRLGTNLNQIARRLNDPRLGPAERGLSAQEKAELRVLREAMSRADETLRTLAGDRARRGDLAFSLTLSGGGNG